MLDSIQTPADLDALPTPVIVDYYNKLTGKTIKGFHTRTKGIEQTFKALQAKRADGEIVTEVKSNKVSIDDMVEQTKKTPLATTRHKRAGRAGRIDPNAVIEILQEENPKRPETRAHAQYECLLAFDGCTVQEFLDAESEGGPKGWARAELIWSEKKGFIAPITKENG